MAWRFGEGGLRNDGGPLPKQISMSVPDIADDDIEAVVNVLRSGVLSLGEMVPGFEAAFSDYIGAAHAVAVSSGTAGLHLSLHALGIGPGDEVITTPFSFVASANAILYQGAKPIFVDVDDETMTIDPDAVAASIGARTRALLPVHVFGQPCAMRPLTVLAERHGLKLVEDACEAIGGDYEGRSLGTFGDAAVFSFYPNKQMTTGEGGIVTTRDPMLAERLSSLRNQGRCGGAAWLNHAELGFNYRMTEMSAALGLSQLRRLEAMLGERERVAMAYAAKLVEIGAVRFLQPAAAATRFSWFAAIVRLAAEVDRDAVMARLERMGVPTRAYFSPLHLQPHFRKLLETREGDFPKAEALGRSVLALPFHGRMSADQVSFVCEALSEAVRHG
jgi:perosamine synthetase